MKNKKNNSYKPYDTSNSFVRRVTSRVSQFLPQPTSWLNRLLSREPEQAGPSLSQETEEDEVSIQPPSKRMRTVQTCTDLPTYRNNIRPTVTRRLEDRREEELSPIRSYKLPPSVNIGTSSIASTSAAPVAGPSGLNRHNFVASTPAVSQVVQEQQPIQPKVNGDDGSSSDSGSHVSSLQGDQVDQPRQPSLFHSRSFNRNRPIRPEESSNLMRSKQLRLDLSNSSLSSSRGGGRVSFDTTVFNSPFKGRLCGGFSLNQSQDSSFTESPFYRSNTTFGGNSSCSESMLRTRSLHSEIPVVVQPTQTQRNIDNLGSSTKKILKALEQFSTPMLDQSKRVQYSRDRGIKRKVEVPYKELVIPQMPDLLRIKRRDARRKVATSIPCTTALPASVTPASQSHVVFSKISQAESLASQSSSTQLSQRLTKPESVISKVKTDSTLAVDVRRSEDSKSTCTSNSSSNVITGLPLTKTSLPKFDSTLVKSVSKQPVSSPWKFSKPISVAEESSCSPIPPPKKFSQPIMPGEKEESVNSKTMTNCVNNMGSQGSETMTYLPPSKPILKKKENATPVKPTVTASSELKSGSVLDVLNKCTAPVSNELKTGSVMDVLQKKPDSLKKEKWECRECYVVNNISSSKCAACEQPRQSAPPPKPAVTTEKKEAPITGFSGFGDKFKMSSDQWECSGCLVRNKKEENKCVACGQGNPNSKVTAKPPEVAKPTVLTSGFGDKFKPPSGSWECSVCLVQNKADDSKCVSCSSDKPGEKSKSVQPLTSLFKKPQGSWECDTCLVRNKSDVTSCVSCGTTKPGATKSPASNTFSFGIPSKENASNESAPKITFGVSSSSTNPNSKPPTFSFGSNVPSSQQSSTPKFSFGMPAASETKPTSVNNVENKTESVKDVADSGVVSETPKFSFGVPDSNKSIFGNVTTSCASTVPSSTPSVGFSNAVSSSAPAASNLPIFVDQISSSKSVFTSLEKTTTAVSSPIFTSSLGEKNGLNMFQSPNPSETPVFGSQNDMVTSPVISAKNENINSISSSDKSVTENKPNLFAFGSNNATENKNVFNSTPSSESAGFNFGTTSNSFLSQNTASLAQPKSTFGTFGGFSSTTEQPKSNLNAFGAPQENAFKPAEPTFTFAAAKTEQPAPTPFQFGSSTTNHTNSFTTATPTNQFNSNSFGTPSTAAAPFSTQGSIFGSTAPQPAQTASFLFGASQTNDRPPPAPTFNFTAQGGGVTGGFTFGQTQSVQPSVQPPSFDPNKKPVFNFSQGQTPTFSAQTTPGTITTDRKIRKAVRRTTQK